MADDSRGATQVLQLTWGGSGTAFDLAVTFTGSAAVHYGEAKPPAGSVTLELAHGGESQTVVWLQSDWGEPHEAYGYQYRVLNPPALQVRDLQIEVRRAS